MSDAPPRADPKQAPFVVLLHGGPGAPGYLEPVARELGRSFRVLAPDQRRSGGAPLTVARHVDDLEAIIAALGPGERPSLVGHSWGAMLALAFAAAHPGRVSSLALVACGTFDARARQALWSSVERRMDESTRRRVERLPAEIADPDERLRALGTLTLPVYSFDAVAEDAAFGPCDARAHQETWADMIRLQEEGVFPAAFAAVDAPVLMVHGADDPHPGGMIRDGLAPYLGRMEYLELRRCGHYPWLERHAREAFYARLTAWLERPRD